MGYCSYALSLCIYLMTYNASNDKVFGEAFALLCSNAVSVCVRRPIE
jgi:hypothetical protein